MCWHGARGPDAWTSSRYNTNNAWNFNGNNGNLNNNNFYNSNLAAPLALFELGTSE